MVLRPERKKNGFEEKNISIFVFLKNLDLSKVEYLSTPVRCLDITYL